MAVCEYCQQEMLDPAIVHCSWNREVQFPDGVKLPTLSYYVEGQPHARCHDCNVESGYKHHPGCDMEECPRCLGQLISCRCLDEEEEA